MDDYWFMYMGQPAPLLDADVEWYTPPPNRMLAPIAADPALPPGPPPPGFDAQGFASGASASGANDAAPPPPPAVQRGPV